MTTPLWQPSDGQLLKSLREQAGLDQAVLARMASMTVQHLRGLEEGEGGEFYSPAIKAQMGRALLAKLGHVTMPPAQARAAGTAPQSTPEPKRRVSAAAASLPVPAAPSGLANASLLLRPGRTALLLLLSLVLVAAAAWLLAAPSRTAPARTANASAKPSTPAAQPEPSQARAECDPQDSRPRIDFTPAEPRKAGNFVHLVADRPIRLCVVDGQSKATRLELEEGAGRSVYGAAPFTLQGELVGLRVFYQGVRVQGELSAQSRVVLNEAPLR